jgi:hypothetical protein
MAMFKRKDKFTKSKAFKDQSTVNLPSSVCLINQLFLLSYLPFLHLHMDLDIFMILTVLVLIQVFYKRSTTKGCKKKDSSLFFT